MPENEYTDSPKKNTLTKRSNLSKYTGLNQKYDDLKA